MMKSIEDRVQDSFSKDNREDIFKYLDLVRSTVLGYSQSMRKMVTFLILLIAIFELVANSSNVQVTVASFRITRGSVVLDLLPALIAFLFSQAMADAVRANQLTDIYSKVFALWSKKAYDNDLDTELLGPLPLYWMPTSGEVSDENLAKSTELVLYTSQWLSFAFITAVIIFEAHAYYVLFSTNVPAIIMWAVSACCTLFFLTFTTAIFIKERSR